MLKQLLTGVASVTLLTSFAQEVVSTQGDSYSNADGSIDYTIGEVVTFTGTDGNNDLTQGFHQTNWNFVGLDDHAPDLHVSVFPNPVEHTLTIRTDDYAGIQYQLIDNRGRIVRTNELDKTETSIDVKDILPGAYSLQLTGQNQQNLKSFKLVKHH